MAARSSCRAVLLAIAIAAPGVAGTGLLATTDTPPTGGPVAVTAPVAPGSVPGPGPVDDRPAAAPVD